MKNLSKKLPSLDDIKTEKARRHFSEYIKQSWDVIEPGIEYMHNWHIDAIAEYLEAVKIGQIRRLIINLPPRYMKSIEVTVMFPTWIWIEDPYKRFIAASYSAALSKKHNINKRDIITSPWYQNRWADRYVIKDDKNTQTNFENDKKGFMFATSINGTLTGEGGDIIIIDDPHNPKQAESEAERNTAIEFCKTTLPTRLNNKKKGAIIVVMQRLHDQDVSGYFLSQGGWEHLCLEGVAEKRTIMHYPISGREFIREEGDLLWPEREGPEEIAAMKKSLGSYGFSGQYQQAPSPSGGGKIKRHWWKYWKPKGLQLPPVAVRLESGEWMYTEAEDIPDYWDEQLQSWDCSFKDEKENDLVAGGVWGRRLANCYLLDVVNQRMDIIETINGICTFTEKWPKTLLKLIEGKANGPAVIQLLRNKISGLIDIEPEGGKIARVNAVSPSIEAGNVYVPHPLIYPWVNDFLEQCSKFPRGANDDMVDMMSQALNRLMYRDFNTKEEVKNQIPWMFRSPEKQEGYITW